MGAVSALTPPVVTPVLRAVAPVQRAIAPTTPAPRSIVTPRAGSAGRAPSPPSLAAASSPVVQPLRTVERGGTVAASLEFARSGAALAAGAPAPGAPTPQAPAIQRSAAPSPTPSVQLAGGEGSAPAGPTADLPSASAGESAADVGRIAAQVYELLVRRIADERERRGH